MRQVSDDILQRHAVSCLIGHCAAIAESGHLSEPSERSLRMLIAYVLSAYHMPPKAERAFQPLPQELPDHSPHLPEEFLGFLPDEFHDDRFEKLAAPERNAHVATPLRLIINSIRS